VVVMPIDGLLGVSIVVKNLTRGNARRSTDF